MAFKLFQRDWKQSDYPAGFLKIPEVSYKLQASDSNFLIKPSRFVAPRKIDNRDLFLSSSNQGTTSKCAAYSTAGYIEAYNWKVNGYPEQINPDSIYAEAKKIDGDPDSQGTTLDAACKAAINLNLIKGDIKLFNGDFDLIKYTIHRYGSCILGFMITNEWNYTNTKTGRISDFGTKAIRAGGHAIVGCGYDNEGLYIQNSWGSDWSLYGFALISWQQVYNQFIYGAVIIPNTM